MVYINAQMVVAILHAVGNVECPDGTTYQFFRIFMAVEGHGSVGAHTLKLQEVALVAVFRSLEHLTIGRLAVQVAMTQLTVAVIVVEVMGNSDVSSDRIATY